MSLVKALGCILVLAIAGLLVVLPNVNITDYMQSSITSKFMVFAYSCSVITVGFLVMFFFIKTKAIHISKLDIALFLLVSYIIINRYSIQPEHVYSIRFFELLGLSILYIILRNLQVKVYAWFLFAIIISGSVQAVYGNLQILGFYPSNHSGFKLTGSFFNPGPYAGFLTIVYVVSFGVYLYKEHFIQFLNLDFKNKKVSNTIKYVVKNILLLALISIILVVPATRSRAAWIGVLLSSIILLELRYQFVTRLLTKVNYTKRIALVVLTICIMCIGLFSAYQFKKGSADGRLFIWKVTTEIIKDSPIAGLGLDRFKTYYMNYQANYFVKHGETIEAFVADNTYYAFNDWLQFFTEQGVIGLILLLFLIYVLLNIKTITEYTIIKFLVLTTFIAAGIFASFSYPMQILPFKLVIVLMLSLIALLDTNKYAIKIKQRLRIIALSKSILAIIIILFLIEGIPYTKKVSEAYKNWKTALNKYQYSDYVSAIDNYKKAYPILKNNGDFLMNYGKALTMNKMNDEAIEILERAKLYLNTTILETALGDAYKGTKQFSKAETAYLHAANMIPSRFYPLYLLVKLYDENGEGNKAVELARDILKKKVKVPSTAIKEIKAEMRNIIDRNKDKQY
ncbi:O-antigen ligase family protein [Wocania ichthyoenteri]|uniref:O-antigen ligase family protein n=1 Tax=Wocania ichthyoenteri TaxID=1230531 RepID=UPI000AD64C1F|nr:O-antigen ligase family protein [Wocania ichthyoenteri]